MMLRHLTGNGELFFQLLLLVEAGVVAVEREQFIMPADFDDPSPVQAQQSDLRCAPSKRGAR